MAVSRNRLLLSVALVGGSLWCLDQVRQAHARPPIKQPVTVNRSEPADSAQARTPSAGRVAGKPVTISGNYQ